MVGFVVTGHGTFASGMASALAMVAGERDNLCAVSLTEENVYDFPRHLGWATQDLLCDYGPVVIFCDFAGGIPCRHAVLLAEECREEGEDVRVVAGVNLPMLIECLLLTDADPSMGADAAVELAVTSGSTAIGAPRLGPRLQQPPEQSDPKGVGL